MNTLKRLVTLAFVAIIAVSAVAVSAVSVSADETYDYQIKVKTGTKLGAGTDADVYMFAYDKDGNLINNRRISLDADGDSFENGDTDTISISLPAKIDSIKIATMQHHGDMFVNLDNSDNEWYLDNINISLGNGEQKTFYFNKWIEPGYYAYTKVIRDRHSIPKLKYEYVPESLALYDPSSVS